MPTPAAASTPPPMKSTVETVAIDDAESKSASAFVGQILSLHCPVASLSLLFAIKPVTRPPTSAAPPTPSATNPTVRRPDPPPPLSACAGPVSPGGGAAGGGAAAAVAPAPKS